MDGHDESGCSGRNNAAQTKPAALVHILREVMPTAVIALALLAILYTFYFASDLFLPIFFAFFLSIILRPLVRSLTYAHIPETIGALIVLCGLVGTILVATVSLSPPAEKWIEQLPEIRREIEVKIWPVTQSLERAKDATEQIGTIADGEEAKAQNSAVTIEQRSLLDRLFATTWLSLVQILITLALTFFFLARRTNQTRETIRKLPWPEYHDTLAEIMAASQSTVVRFLRVSVMIYVVLGLITGAAMAVLGMPYPLLWAILATVFGFMPYVGPLIVFACIGAVSLLSFEDTWQILAPPMVYGALTIVEGYFITPTILGRHLTLSPIAIFLSMLLWTWIWGMPGALLSVPILVVATVVMRHTVAASRTRQIAGAVEHQPRAMTASA